MHKILALWATPRSTSTAFEWMMRTRGDFHCYHESFNELYYYGEDRQSQRDAHVAARADHTYDNVWTDIFDTAQHKNIFLKDFAYSVEHMITDDMLDRMTHSFLIRDPRKVIQGLNHHWPDCTFQEVGFAELRALFDRVAVRTGELPVVITSDDLLHHTRATVEAYCNAMDIEFMAHALEWEPGERREVSWYGEGTGPWHDALRSSTGIQAQKTNYPPIEDDPRLVDLYERSLPHYEALLAYRLPIESKSSAQAGEI